MPNSESTWQAQTNQESESVNQATGGAGGLGAPGTGGVGDAPGALGATSPAEAAASPKAFLTSVRSASHSRHVSVTEGLSKPHFGHLIDDAALAGLKHITVPFPKRWG